MSSLTLFNPDILFLNMIKVANCSLNLVVYRVFLKADKDKVK